MILIISKQCYLLYFRSLTIYTFYDGGEQKGWVHLQGETGSTTQPWREPGILPSPSRYRLALWLTSADPSVCRDYFHTLLRAKHSSVYTSKFNSLFNIWERITDKSFFAPYCKSALATLFFFFYYKHCAVPRLPVVLDADTRFIMAVRICNFPFCFMRSGNITCTDIFHFPAENLLIWARQVEGVMILQPRMWNMGRGGRWLTLHSPLALVHWQQ